MKKSVNTAMSSISFPIQKHAQTEGKKGKRNATKEDFPLNKNLSIKKQKNINLTPTAAHSNTLRSAHFCYADAEHCVVTSESP